MSAPGHPSPVRAVGLMVGTSLDGVDAALVEAPSLARLEELRLIEHDTLAFGEGEDRRLREIAAGASTTAEELSALRFGLVRRHEEAVGALGRRAGLDAARLDWVAAHGVTLWHAPGPRGGHGWQLHCGAALAARLGCVVVDEFRAADVALGGEGAPLAPLVDLGLRATFEEDRGILNLGGIANLTLLGAGVSRTDELVAGDVGPANLPLDALCREELGRPFDEGGEVAANGRPLETVVEAVLSEDWVRRSRPRSFGREEFGPAWLEDLRRRAVGASAADLLATVIEIEVRALEIFLREQAGGWRRRPDRSWSLYLTGGGRHNHAWRRRAEARLEDVRVRGIEELGVPADAKEAVDFAFLGGQTLRRRRSGNRAITGAARDLVLGSVHDPHGRLR